MSFLYPVNRPLPCVTTLAEALILGGQVEVLAEKGALASNLQRGVGGRGGRMPAAPAAAAAAHADSPAPPVSLGEMTAEH